MLVEKNCQCQVKATHVQKTTSRNNSLKFDKSLTKLDMDMCAYHILVLVLLAQLLTVELSISHQKIDCNNLFCQTHSLSSSLCASFLALSKTSLVPRIIAFRRKKAYV